MLDLKAHVLRGRSLHVIRGTGPDPDRPGRRRVTVASFVLNALFAFAVTQSGEPAIGRLPRRSAGAATQIVTSGAIVGATLAFAATVVPRWGRPWFGLVLGIVVGMMMVCYVAVPARLIGVKPIPVQSRKAQDERGRRSAGRDGVRAAVPAGASRHPDARLQGPADPRRFPDRDRRDAAGRSDRSGEGDQDERPPGTTGIRRGRPSGGVIR